MGNILRNMGTILRDEGSGGAGFTPAAPATLGATSLNTYTVLDQDNATQVTVMSKIRNGGQNGDVALYIKGPDNVERLVDSFNTPSTSDVSFTLKAIVPKAYAVVFVQNAGIYNSGNTTILKQTLT